MTAAEFESLSKDLRTVASKIPLNWGHIQNNRYDYELKQVCDIFAVTNLAELERHISRFDEDHKGYYRRRWYLLRCADCDEYLFYCNDNVEHNPDRFDKEWDIRIDNKYKFDVKGTVIPKSFRDQYEEVLNDPRKIIEFYYDHQSKGVRFDMQNRLFIVHHSLVDQRREFYLRCAWGSKASVYKRFVENVENIEFYEYKGCTAGVIFILEETKNDVKCLIDGLDHDR